MINFQNFIFSSFLLINLVVKTLLGSASVGLLIITYFKEPFANLSIERDVLTILFVEYFLEVIETIFIFR